MWLSIGRDGVRGWLRVLEELRQETALDQGCSGVLFLGELPEQGFLRSSVLDNAASWQRRRYGDIEDLACSVPSGVLPRTMGPMGHRSTMSLTSRPPTRPLIARLAHFPGHQCWRGLRIAGTRWGQLPLAHAWWMGSV